MLNVTPQIIKLIVLIKALYIIIGIKHKNYIDLLHVLHYSSTFYIGKFSKTWY